MLNSTQLFEIFKFKMLEFENNEISNIDDSWLKKYYLSLKIYFSNITKKYDFLTFGIKSIFIFFEASF